MSTGFVPRLALFIFFASTAGVWGHGVQMEESDVIELDPKNLDSALANGGWLLEFYAPWCGYCRRMEQTYAEVATELKISGSGVKVARVDGAAYKALGARFRVEGFPTIFYIQNGEVWKYAGERSKDALIQYASKGWMKQEPSFSTWASPLGTLGRILGVMLDISVILQTLYENARMQLNLSHPYALGLVTILTALLGGILGFIMSIIFPDLDAERAVPPSSQQIHQQKQD